VAETADGERTFPADHVISTMPLRSLVRTLTPAPPAETAAAAEGLSYRDFLVVALMIRREKLFPDNWIYVHTPGVKVGRIQNFNNWSKAMVPVPGVTCVGMEYFCFKGDELWESSDEDLVELGKREIEQLGLAKAANVERGFVTRVPKAYPMYDADYSERVDVIKSWLAGISNIQQVGRNGLHRYNNSDHSMLTAMRAVENIMTGSKHDLWAVNAESAYHEEHQEPEQPYKRVPATAYEREPLHATEEAAA